MNKKGALRVNRQQLEDLLNHGYYAKHPEVATRIRDRIAGNPTLKPERLQQSPLGGTPKDPTSMVNIPGSVHCRFIRTAGKGAKIYDDDNFSGGLKECRDSVAAMLGLKGDSPKDGITFSYCQEMDTTTRQSKLRIEVYAG